MEAIKCKHRKYHEVEDETKLGKNGGQCDGIYIIHIHVQSSRVRYWMDTLQQKEKHEKGKKTCTRTQENVVLLLPSNITMKERKKVEREKN